MAHLITLPTGIPVAERFSFLLTTLLSDIAAKSEIVRDEIINTQIEVLSTLTNGVIRTVRDDQLRSHNAKSKLERFLLQNYLSLQF